MGVALFVAIWYGAFTIATGQDVLTPAERRGKQVYLQGTSPSGKEILAYIGESSLEMPGSAVACANCHGLDGRGKPEGGLDPSNITWDVLTKPYGQIHPNGRKHPPYTERAVEIAITRGSDPAGNRLSNVMPRYQMSREDIVDLIAYLERLGREREPGVTETQIVVGTIVPNSGPLAEVGQAIRAVMTAFIAELNSGGGIYNRRFELKFIETGNTATGTRVNVERFIDTDQIFVITGAFIAGAEKEIVQLADQRKVPIIGPITLYPQIAFPLNRQVFYLYSGVDGQASTLIDFVARKYAPGKPNLRIVYPTSEPNVRVVEAIKEQCKKDGLSIPGEYPYIGGQFSAAAFANQVRREGSEVIFFLGSGGEALTLMQEAEKINWFPAIFMPGGMGGAEVFKAPVGFDRKVFVSLPTSPADQTPEGIEEFRALARKYKLPEKHLAVQISAFSAGKLLVEALKRSGRDVSREKLIQSLEGLYQYSTGLTPPVTFGPNRRIGAMGAYVVTIDLTQKQFLPVGGWMFTN